MTQLLHWLVFLALLSISFVPAHFGVQFSDFAHFFMLTAVSVVAVLLAMRFMQRKAPIHSLDATEKTDDT